MAENKVAGACGVVWQDIQNLGDAYLITDNRANPPDDGILLQVYDGISETHYVEIQIKDEEARASKKQKLAEEVRNEILDDIESRSGHSSKSK